MAVKDDISDVKSTMDEKKKVQNIKTLENLYKKKNSADYDKKILPFC